MQTFTGLEYLKMDIASSFGLDKLDWDQRLAWFNDHEHEFEEILPAAEKPALFYGGVKTYQATQKGLPTGFPISLDAASSGLQLLACLAGCEDSAKLCGVVSTGHREDAYTVIYQAMCDQVGETAKIARSDCKAAIMSSLYTSRAIPKQVFGEGELLQVFYRTMESMAPGAWSLNFGLQGLWQSYAKSHDWVLPDNFHAHVPVMSQVDRFVQWQNAPVGVSLTVNQGQKDGRSISPNLVHSIDGMIVRELHRRCDYDPVTIREVTRLVELAEQCKLGQGGGRTSEKTENDRMVLQLWGHYRDSGFLSARILDHLDMGNFGHVDHWVIRGLLDSLPRKPFKVISIHDCFRVLPNYGNDLRRTYNQILSEIAASELLASLASQITGQQLVVTKGADISSKILEADYTLC